MDSTPPSSDTATPPSPTILPESTCSSHAPRPRRSTATYSIHGAARSALLRKAKNASQGTTHC
jgi:hypothetical protein